LSLNIAGEAFLGEGMNRHIGRLRVAILALLAFALTASAARADEERSLLIDGSQRNYRIHLPPTPGQPGPVVIALHGMLQSADGMDSYLGLNLVADRETFTVVYPYGLGNSWKDGRNPALRMTFWAPPGDDVEFLSKLVQTLVEQRIADPGRIYLVGLSNGGYMTYRMACERPDLFAAFATLSATVPTTYRTSCKPSRAVPVLMINGTADMIVPFYGNALPGIMSLYPVMYTAKLFAELDGCSNAAESAVPSRGSSGATSVTLIYWSNCRDRSAVVLFRVNNGGHQSPSIGPGRETPIAARMLGMRNHDIDAAEEVWAFFRHYDLSITAGLQRGISAQ
jgi:polyhydroxybutyrate depolymerase